jgi:hypothetical protein
MSAIDRADVPKIKRMLPSEAKVALQPWGLTIDVGNIGWTVKSLEGEDAVVTMENSLDDHTYYRNKEMPLDKLVREVQEQVRFYRGKGKLARIAERVAARYKKACLT